MKTFEDTYDAWTLAPRTEVQNKQIDLLCTNKIFSEWTKDIYFEGRRFLLACNKLYQSATSDPTSEQINIMWVIMWNS